jgi:hypothetical protein
MVYAVLFSLLINLMGFEDQAACCEGNHPPGRASNIVLQSLPPLSPLLSFVRI